MNPKAWRILPRAVMESVLTYQARHLLVPQLLILHGPRGVGKTTIIQERLLKSWNTAPHVTGYVDFAEAIKDHHPKHGNSYPWASWSNLPPVKLQPLRTQLEQCLESMVKKGINLGLISSHQIFKTLNKMHGLSNVLRQIVDKENANGVATTSILKELSLWNRAVLKFSVSCDLEESVGKRVVSPEESGYYKEAMGALELAKEVIRLQQGKRGNALRELNRTGGFSRTLIHSATDWPFLLLRLLTEAAEIDYFQPKLVINNIEVLRQAEPSEDTTVCGSMYHDSLLWRMVGLGLKEGCLPIFLVTSDSYYSYKAFIDFGVKDLFVSRELFGWTPEEAKLHLVGDHFTPSEWKVLMEVIGPNTRHLFEFYALKLSSSFQTHMDEKKGSAFEDIVDAYLAYIQVTVVNPAMERALLMVQQFAMDAHNGKISKDKMCHGVAWRRPPRTDKPGPCREWAKIQLMDFLHAFSNTEFAFNYLGDRSLEMFDDPAAVAMLEVGLVYAQRFPQYIRPLSTAIQRCLVRWLVQEQVKMSYIQKLKFKWQKVFRGRYYCHMMKKYYQVGPKNDLMRLYDGEIPPSMFGCHIFIGCKSQFVSVEAHLKKRRSHLAICKPRERWTPTSINEEYLRFR